MTLSSLFLSKIKIKVKILDFDSIETGSLSIKISQKATLHELKKIIEKKSKKLFSVQNQRLYICSKLLSSGSVNEISDYNLRFLDLDYKLLMYYEINNKSTIYLRTGYELQILLSSIEKESIQQFKLDVEPNDKISNIMAKFMIKYSYIDIKYYRIYHYMNNNRTRQLIQSDKKISELNLNENSILELEEIKNYDYEYFHFY